MFTVGEGDGDLLGVRLGLFDGLGLTDEETEGDTDGDGDREALADAEAEAEAEVVGDAELLDGDGDADTASVVGAAGGSDSPAACRAALGWTSSG